MLTAQDFGRAPSIRKGATVQILGSDGMPINPRRGPEPFTREQATEWVKNFHARRQIRAKYDAAQTFVGNENHWSNADNFDPHSVASLQTRRTLRNRSRYEVIENNPYLKGTLLTIANDFVGRGPKLQITDKRLSVERRRVIETKWQKWADLIKLRRKLWRMRMAKICDGESFLRAYANKNRKVKNPVLLDFQVLECDRVSSNDYTQGAIAQDPNAKYGEVDGVRFDKFENPLAYHILHSHPGGSALFFGSPTDGDWTDSKFIIHWFRQDRGWLRGIPETAPSLPLCALLRRYTLSMVRHAEGVADFTGILETEGPPGQNPWSIDSNGNRDDPFDIFPIEMGMFMNLPWGYKMKQLEAVPLGTQYDEFVSSLLREITRPILTPFNVASGSSKDSNMASAVVDTNIYKGGQESERSECQTEVLDPVMYLWWMEAIRVPGFLGDDLLVSEDFRNEPPDHIWRWDRVGLDHTDPAKVATALETLHNKRFLTDRDIQETYYNRDIEDWQEEIEKDDEFRAGLLLDSSGDLPPPEPPPAPGGSKPPASKKPAAKKKKPAQGD